MTPRLVAVRLATASAIVLAWWAWRKGVVG